MTFDNLFVQRGSVNRTDDAEVSFVQTITAIDTTKTFITSPIYSRATATGVISSPANQRITGSTSLTFSFQADVIDRTFDYELVGNNL